MRRTDFVMKMVAGAVFVAVVCYICFLLYDSAKNPFETYLATKATVSEGAETFGFAVRSESVLSGRGNAVTVTATEGEKVSAGQAVAIGYTGAEAIERANRIRNLTIRIEQLEKNAAGAAGYDQYSDALKSSMDLALAVQRKQLSNLDEISLTVDRYIFQNGAEVDAKELEDLQEELYRLRLGDSGTPINSNVSGIYISSIDGFEQITAADIEGLAPSGLQKLFEVPKPVADTEFGKLVSGIKWYYAAIINSESAKMLSPQKTAQVQFTYPVKLNLSMTVESIGSAENGKCVIIFSSTYNLMDIATLRELTAEIVFDSWTGIRVPKEAIFLDEEKNAFVYLLRGIQARQVYVEILHESGDYYIVEEDVNTLRENSEIIVRANDLYDGKVVR